MNRVSLMVVMVVSAATFVSFLNPSPVLAGQYGSVLEREPYVQLGDAPLAGYGDTNHDQFELMWETSTDPEGTGLDAFEVMYREKGVTEWSDAPYISSIATGFESRTIHFTTIRGLDFDQDYEYRVEHSRDGKIVKSYTGVYHTRITSGDDAPFTFVAFTNTEWKKKIASTRPNFALMLAEGNDSAVSDDIVRFPSAGAREAVALSLDTYSVPKLVEGVTAKIAPPISEIDEKNYAFDYGNAHFLTFDTSSASDTKRFDALMTWAGEDMKTSQAKWKVIFLNNASTTLTDPFSAKVMDMAQVAGVDVVFTSDAIREERSYSAASLPSWYLKDKGTLHVVNSSGFIVADVTASTITFTQFSEEKGAVVDAFIIGDDSAKPLPDFPKGTAKKNTVIGRGTISNSVKIIQEILNLDLDTQVATDGEGSPKNESTKYGMGSEAAVQRFQIKYDLAKKGNSIYGKVDLTTRAKLNDIAFSFIKAELKK
jgi:hypothetical protein